MSIQRYNVTDIFNQLNSCSYDMNDPHYDGYVQWGRKQDLYRIKFKLDELIATGPKFSPEEEWLEEQDKARMFNILKK